MSAFDFEKWLRIFDYKNIEAFLRSEKGKGTMGDAVGRVALSQLIYEIPSSLISILKMMAGGAAAGAAAGAVLSGGLGIVALLFGVVFDLVAVVVLLLAMNWTQHAIAGMLGGKGKYEDLLHLDSLSTAAMNLANIVALVPEFIAVLPGPGAAIGGAMGLLLIPFALLLVAYTIYVTYLTVKINYNLETGRAAAAVALNFVLWIAIAVALVLALAVAMGATLSGLAAG